MLVVDKDEPRYVMDALDDRGVDFEVAELGISVRKCGKIPFERGGSGIVETCSEPADFDRVLEKDLLPNLSLCEMCDDAQFTRVGDYTNTKKSFVVERKRIDDLYGSLTSYRIYSQLDKMDWCFKCQKYLLIEGYDYFCDGMDPFVKFDEEMEEINGLSPLQRLTRVKPKQRNWIYSVVKECVARNISPIQTWNLDETIEFLVQIDAGAGKTPAVRRKFKPMKSLSIAENMLMMVPGIGKVKAKALLDEYGSLSNLVKSIPPEPKSAVERKLLEAFT